MSGRNVGQRLHVVDRGALARLGAGILDGRELLVVGAEIVDPAVSNPVAALIAPGLFFDRFAFHMC